MFSRPGNGQNARASDKAGQYIGMYSIHGRVTHDDMAKLLGGRHMTENGSMQAELILRNELGCGNGRRNII